MSDPSPSPKRAFRFIDLPNLIAVLALIAAGAEAVTVVLQTDAYKKQALFGEQVRACSALVEGSNEFRSAAIALRAADADNAGDAKARLTAARDRMATNTRRIETSLDALDLLSHSETARQAAKLAEQADQHLLSIDQDSYTDADVKGWIAGFDAQVGRAVEACHKDLLR